MDFWTGIILSIMFENVPFFQVLSDGDHLTWDKDDPSALDFVVAVANFR